MTVLLLLLWTIAAILIRTNPNNETSRWGSAIAFFSGCGGLAGVMNETVGPIVRDTFGLHSRIYRIVQMSVGISASLSHYVSPYALLIFSFRSTGLWVRQWSKPLVTFLFGLPILIMYLIFPVIPQFQVDYRLLTLWVGPYVIIANVLLIRSALRERQPSVKRQKKMICIILFPLTMFSLLTNYVMRMIHVEEVWRYNTWFIGFGFIAFLYFAAKYGLFGVKLRFEKQSLENTMRAVSSGTTLLNHTIKNEILKISMSADNIKASPDITVLDTHENVEVITSAAAHMMAMVNRIQDHVQDIVLQEESVAIGDLIERALGLCKGNLELKQIHIQRNYPQNSILFCDPIQVIEVLSNVINNAIDAMPVEGQLDISYSTTKRYAAIVVKDNGTGIAKEHLKAVFEPFFSTKSNRRNNFGLGLSYSYNVMRKHGGMLDIESEVGRGTTVFLRFAMKHNIAGGKKKERRLYESNSDSSNRGRSGLDQNNDTVFTPAIGSAGSRRGNEQGRSHYTGENVNF